MTYLEDLCIDLLPLNNRVVCWSHHDSRQGFSNYALIDWALIAGLGRKRNLAIKLLSMQIFQLQRIHERGYLGVETVDVNHQSEKGPHL